MFFYYLLDFCHAILTLRCYFVALIHFSLYLSENRAGPSNLGSVFSQIILCKQLAPDFNAEELRSIRKDAEDIQRLVDDLSEFMPMEESYGKIPS